MARKAAFNGDGHEAADGAAEPRDFADQARAEEAIFRSRQHEDGLEPGLELSVHHGHLQLEFVIGHGANAAKEYVSLARPGIVDQKPVEAIDIHIGKRSGDLAQHFGAFGEGEERLLFGVAKNCHRQTAENFGAPFDQVEVPIGHRIE